MIKNRAKISLASIGVVSIMFSGNAFALQSSFPVQLPSDWVTAIFTAILAAVGVLQWLNLRKQSKLTRDSLILTKEANEATGQALQIAQRAWICFDNIKIRINGMSRLLWIEYELQNVGNSPAYIYERCDTFILCTDEELPAHPNYNDKQRHDNFSIFPKMINNTIAERVSLTSEYSENPEKIVALGYVLYRDAFGYERKTAYAIRLQGQTPIMKPGYNIAT